MTLLAPALLLGLIGLGLPVLAHLLGREPPRRIRFAAVRFLPRVEPAVTHRRALSNLPLLLVRLALLTLMVVILARPASPRDQDLAVVGVPHDAVLLLDASYSMGLADDGGPRILEAVERATEIVESLPSGSRIALVTSDPGGPRVALSDTRGPVLVSLEGWGEASRHDPGAWILADALPGAVAMLAGATDAERPRVVYAVSDRSARGLASLPPAAADGVMLVPVPVDPGPGHFGLTEARWEPALELDPRAVRITATARRVGGTGTQRVPLVLSVAGHEVARTEVELGPDASTGIEFTHTLLDATGPTPATLRLEVPGDGLPVDDTRFLWLTADEALDVTVVNGDPSELRAHDETFFLTTALSSVREELGVRIRMLAPEQLEDGLRASPDFLDDTDVLILANAPAPSEAIAPAVVDAVAAGMGLWVGVGDHVNAAEYNARLGPVLPLLLREAVLVGTLPGRAEALTEGLAPPDLGHPLFAGLAGDPGLSGARARKIFLLEPDAARNAEAPVAFTSGAPALATRPHEAGRVALLTTTLDRDWSDLPLRPGFLPLAQNTVAWLGDAAHAGGGQGGQLMVGETRTLRAERSITVAGPGGEPRALTADAEGLVQLTETRVPGHYRATGGRRQALDVFVVNVDPADADTAAVWTAPDSSSAPAGLRAVASWHPRWHALVLLAALLLAIEAILRLSSVRRRR